MFLAFTEALCYNRLKGKSGNDEDVTDMYDMREATSHPGTTKKAANAANGFLYPTVSNRFDIAGYFCHRYLRFSSCPAAKGASL